MSGADRVIRWSTAGAVPGVAAVAAWPAVALAGSHELLRMVVRGSQVPAGGRPGAGHGADPLQKQAAELFAGQLAADRVPSVRAIRAELHVGRARAQRLRDYLAAGVQDGRKIRLREQLAGRRPG